MEGMETPQIQLVVPQFHGVVRSFSKKAMLEYILNGQRKYESEDFHSTHKEDIPLAEATPEKIGEVSARLFALCVMDVETDISIRTRKLREAAGLSVQPLGKEYLELKDIIDRIEKAAKKEEVDAVVEQIKQMDSALLLNDVQKEYLRGIVRKANAKLE